MSIAAGCISRAFGNSKELAVKAVDAPNIIGYKESGNGNVQNVGFGQRFEVEV